MAIRILSLIFVLMFSTFSFAGSPGERRPAAVAPEDHFNVFGDLLVWGTEQDAMGYAVRCPSALGNALSIANNLCETSQINPNWNAGFRVGAGYTWSPDVWDVQARWTWFQNHEDTAILGNYFPMWTHPNSDLNQAAGGGLDVSAAASWNMQFNGVDLELGKEFKPGMFFSLRPHFGAKAAFLDQDFNVNYQNSTTLSQFVNNSVFMTNDFGGIGVRGGFDAFWDLDWYGLSLFGKSSFAILFGEFKTHYIARRDALGVANVRDKWRTTKSVLEGAIGVNMHTTDLLGDEYPLDFYVMWENQQYFAQNQIMRFTGEIGQSTSDGRFIHEKGDFGFNGVTFGVNVDFSI